MFFQWCNHFLFLFYFKFQTSYEKSTGGSTWAYKDIKKFRVSLSSIYVLPKVRD